MDIQRAYQEEQERLEQTLQEIEHQLSEYGPRYYGDDYVEQVLEAKRELNRNRLELLRKEPYFGRLDFEEQDSGRKIAFYIGKRGMERLDTGERYIIDWRAPVASMFYSFTGGEDIVSYNAPDGLIEGMIHLKRNVSVREQTLQRVVDSYVRGGGNFGIGDEFLLYRLGERKDSRLRDIVSTIQAEQDRIIRAPRNEAMIIQGAAGSGKTTVALHRLAYLLYQHQGQIRAERTIIFAPNAMFLNYISVVLPELGVGNVQQTTFAEWALSILGKHIKLADQSHKSRWFSVKGDRPEINERTPGRFKGSLAFKNLIDTRLQKLKETYVIDQSFEPWEGIELPAETIRQWFDVEYCHYPLYTRRERLIGRLKRWLEMQLADIADPQVRKERSKGVRQRFRAYEKKFAEMEVMTFYQSLFGINHEKAASRAKADHAADSDIPDEIVEYTVKYLKRGMVQPEDLAPLLWIYQAFHGPPKRLFDHVVVDEAQDFSPFQLALLCSMMREPSFTILGDLAQGIHAYQGIYRWKELSSIFADHPVSYHELRQSYRSTMEIIEFANQMVPFTDTGLPSAQPVFRSGDPVSVIRIENENERLKQIDSFIRENQQQGMQTIAVIGRTEEECAQLHQLLYDSGVKANLLAEGQNEYSGGVSIVPVYQAKGLEFDAVLLMDADSIRYKASPQDAKLLYVGCTRALHRLALLYQGEASPLICTD